jgi:hypothetical protein
MALEGACEPIINRTSVFKKKRNFDSSMNYNFNSYHESHYLEFHKTKLEAIQNKWQNPKMVPTLANNLDKVLPHPGIYPTESVNKLNEGKLGDYFTRLPQYSEIDESCIPPYFPPS